MTPSCSPSFLRNPADRCGCPVPDSSQRRSHRCAAFCGLTKETIKMRTHLRLIAFGPASLLTRGSDMGALPEPDFGVWRPLA